MSGQPPSCCADGQFTGAASGPGPGDGPPGIPGAAPQPALSLSGVLPGEDDGSALAHALRRIAAGQADPGAADPIANHDSYM